MPSESDKPDEPLRRTRILSKPRRLRRRSISDARFPLFNIKRDIADHYLFLFTAAYDFACCARFMILARVIIRSFSPRCEP
jgi:hypothetical protein